MKQLELVFFGQFEIQSMKKVGQLLQTLAPEIPFTLSHELNPIMREYRRASSVVIDASIKPLMQNHLTELQMT